MAGSQERDNEPGIETFHRGIDSRRRDDELFSRLFKMGIVPKQFYPTSFSDTASRAL